MELVPFLDTVAFEQAVLIPCTDEWVLAISRLPSHYQARFRTSAASPETLETLIDKGKLYELLKKLEIPHPRTIPVVSGADLPPEAVVRNSAYFLKPRDSLSFFRKFHVKAFKIDSPSELALLLRQCKLASLETILQEYIPGAVTNHIFVDGFVDREGRWCAAFARRRLRMYPEHFGNSSYLVTVPLDEVKEQLAFLQKLFRSVSYRGVFSAEFKTDERDAQPKLLEINVRPWWYIGFAQRCGIAIPEMIYRDAIDQPVSPAPPYRAGVRMVYPYTDLYASLDLWKQGKLGLLSWAKSWLIAKQAIFSIRDPMPSIFAIWQRLRRALGRRVRRRTQ